MKICILTTAYPRWRGDTRGIFVHDFARKLVEAGNKVLVIAMHNPNALIKEEIDGVNVISFNEKNLNTRSDFSKLKYLIKYFKIKDLVKD
ncbi:MAG: hypothetical protein N3D16_10785, partial [Anaerolineales bacterium]|nr:hypothetical protein [Anaerolineales bacterium]